MKNKKITISLIVIILILVIGVSYAFFSYSKIGDENSQLVTGDVYMHFNETGNEIILTNAFPETKEEAKLRNDNYMTFTISGKNTTKNKDIYYELKLNEGSEIEGKQRFNPKDLKFELIETIGGVSKTVIDGESYKDFNDHRFYVNTIPNQTNNEIEISYQLRMWISDEVIISDTEENANYTTDVYKNSYASIKVNVYGDFVEKEIESSKNLYTKLENALMNNLLEDDGDTRIVFGSNEEVDNNYIWYSGKLWRVVALNNDGSIKMITEEQITDIIWGESNNYKESWIYQWLNEDFLDTLYNYENLIITDYNWNATSMTTTEKPENISVVNAPVGLLNYYEYAKSHSNDWYLDNNNLWWLMTPRQNNSYVYYIVPSGNVDGDRPVSNLNGYGVRPVINLKADVYSYDGDGSEENPYKILGDIAIVNNNFLNSRISGEYVKFDNELYRIVGVDDEKTKLSKVEYLDDADVIITKSFASSRIFGSKSNTKTNDYWDYYLNNTWYGNISSEYRNMIVDGTWYLGDLKGGSYKNTICADLDTLDTTKTCTKTSNIYIGKIGLGRIGEMFTSQISKVDVEFWTISPYSGVLMIESDGEISYEYSIESVYGDSNLSKYAVRPSFYLSQNVYITGGLGTLKKPFEIAIK